MTKNSKAVRTVAATCPCGKSFNREIRRGRPQVWCDKCMAIPFAKRINMPVTTETKVHTDVEGVERIANQWDVHDAIRPTIEANVAEVNAAWPAKRAALIAKGVDALEASFVHQADVLAAYKAAGV